MKVLLLCHTDLVPPEDAKSKDIDRFTTPWITEWDVKQALIKLGHEVWVVGIYDDLTPLTVAIESFQPNIVFNLLEEFSGQPQMDYKIASLIELLNIPITGCSSKGLLIARDKALSKKILKYHRIGTPQFFVMPKKSKKKKIPKTVKYPLIVKCLFEEASYGIAKASIVNSKDKLEERIQYIHEKLDQDAIVEEFIPGKELFVGITGNKQLKTYPIWELVYENVDDPSQEIYTQRAKWNEKYRDRKGINSKAAKLPKDIEEKVLKTCKKVYQVLSLNGCARIDLRLTEENKIYILEANPNPNLAIDDELAKSAKFENTNYEDLIKSLINLA